MPTKYLKKIYSIRKKQEKKEKKGMKTKRTIFILLIFLIASSLTYSQFIPRAKLVGIVLLEDGSPCPGVTVTINSPSLILKEMVALTSTRGFYRFSEVPGGTYQVKFAMPGMKTIIREGIILSRGGSATLNLTLEPSPIEEEVTVVGKAPTVDLQHGGTKTTLTKDLLEGLPAYRDFHAIYNLVPGMYATSDGGGTVSFGSSARSHKITIDGMMISDIATGDTLLEPGFNTMEEVFVEQTAHKAEYGKVMGAIIQVVTKSGGNKFHGEVEALYRNKGFVSDNTKGTPLEGQYKGFDRQFEPGFSIGGPLKQDKLWFFLGGNMNSDYFYAFGYPLNNTVPNQLINKTRYMPLGKLTWQLDTKNKIVAQFNWRGLYNDHRGAGWWAAVSNTQKEDRGGWLASMQWTSTFSQDFILNVRAGYSDFHQDMLAKYTDRGRLIEQTTGVETGNRGFSGFYHRNRFQSGATGTYFVDDWMGSHEFKAGIDFEWAEEPIDEIYYGEPHLNQPGMWDDGFVAVEVGLWNGVPQWVWVGQSSAFRSTLTAVGGFFQDTWNPNRYLTLNLGARYDWGRGRIPEQYNKHTGDLINTQFDAMKWSQIAPRLGIIVDPWGDGKTALKASFSRYYSPVITQWFTHVNPASWTSFMAALNPDWSVNYLYGWYSPGQGVADEDLLNPYEDEFTFGFERELFEDFSFSVTGIFKWSKRWMDRVDRNHLDVELLKETGELSWNGYTPVTGIDPYNGEEITFYEMDDDGLWFDWYSVNITGSNRTYRGVEFKITKRMSHRWSMLTSYVWGRLTGLFSPGRGMSWGSTGFFDSPNDHVNADGKVEYQAEHQVKVQTVWLAPLGIDISVFYEFRSGEPFTRWVDAYTVFGGPLFQGQVWLRAEKRGSQRLPAQHRIDMRLKKNFRIGAASLYVWGDVFNLLNSNTTTWYGDNPYNYQQIFNIIAPRYFKIGVGYKF